MSIGFIILIVLLSIYCLGVFVNFFGPIIYFLRNDIIPENYSHNICIIFFDALLWPGDIINCLFCTSGNRRRTNAVSEINTGIACQNNRV
tara:strand:- start:4215 stop:4484 length:270 start_codon:yes stop_codon:yes gene_type:complete